MADLVTILVGIPVGIAVFVLPLMMWLRFCTGPDILKAPPWGFPAWVVGALTWVGWWVAIIVFVALHFRKG